LKGLLRVQPKIYTVTEHGIDKSRIDPDAAFVIDRLISAGHLAYLVGGCVRDLLLNHKPKDFDISTSALPEEIKGLFRSCFLIGRRFRLAHVRVGKKVLEVSTFRKGDNEDASLILQDNDWGSEVEDVLRRDFTINGLYYSPENETIIDYVDGYIDAKKQYLRSIGNPHIRFKQDPVRMIRLIKFKARFGLEIDPEAKHALIECRREILKSAKPRILEEILRMLESGSSTAFFRLMADSGILSILLPKLSDFFEHKERGEIFSFFEEIDRTIKSFESIEISRAVLLSSIAFPILHRHVRILQSSHNRPLHLGEIHMEAQFIIQEIFGPFLQIPKKISASLASIITSQFRFTPMQEKKKTPYRIPSSPDFPEALEFFKLRASVEPGLQKIYEEWDYYFRKLQRKRTTPHR
jgi:poly(A) polymerase